MGKENEIYNIDNVCSVTLVMFDSAILWTAACQASLSMGIPMQEKWKRLHGPPPEDLPNPGIETVSLLSPILQAGSSPLSHQRSP